MVKSCSCGRRIPCLTISLTLTEALVIIAGNVQWDASLMLDAHRSHVAVEHGLEVLLFPRDLLWVSVLLHEVLRKNKF